MIARHSAAGGASSSIDVWSALAAPLPAGAVSWRQDGRPTTRDGKHFARFVAYIEANTVRERLDSVVPGDWDVTIERLPPVVGLDADANQGLCNFKARLQILGVIREDVGTGKDYKQAATDAFKRAAVRFGIGHELYAYEQNWVQVDGDGRYAKPVEDPDVAYRRRYGARPAGAPVPPSPRASAPAAVPAPAAVVPDDIRSQLGDDPEDTALLDPTPVATATAPVGDDPTCPKCGSRMWDNRLTKKNPKAPDFKCRDRSCDGVIWPPKTTAPAAAAKPGRESVQGPLHRDEQTEQGLDMADDGDLPF